MSKEQQKKGVEIGKNSIKSTLIFSQHARVTAMVAAISLTSIALLGGGGYYIDLTYDTKPFFLIAGVLLSFPLSQIAIYKWVKKHYVPRVKKLSQDS